MHPAPKRPKPALTFFQLSPYRYLLLPWCCPSSAAHSSSRPESFGTVQCATADGYTLFAGSASGRIAAVDARMGRFLSVFQAHDSPVSSQLDCVTRLYLVERLQCVTMASAQVLDGVWVVDRGSTAKIGRVEERGHGYKTVHTSHSSCTFT